MANFPTIALTLLMIFIPFRIQATEFSDDFESTNVTTVATFTLSSNGISAVAEGGTAFQIGNGALYHSGVKSWMVEPAGTNERGTHDGSGTITFSVPMSRISFWVRSEFTEVTSTVTLLDVDGNIAENSSVTTVISEDWTQVNFTITDGAAALESVLLEVSGTGMAALDDLEGTSVDDVDTGSPPPTDTSSGGSSGGGGTFSLMLMLVLAVGSKLRR